MAAMFSKNESGETTESLDKNDTIIGSSVHVEGVFTSEDSIHIYGTVKGTLTTKKDITIGANASVEADITAKNVNISGELKGNIHATGMVQLASSARVYGDIQSQIFSVETGATLHGQCVTGQENTDDSLEKGATAEGVGAS